MPRVVQSGICPICSHAYDTKQEIHYRPPTRRGQPAFPGGIVYIHRPTVVSKRGHTEKVEPKRCWVPDGSSYPVCERSETYQPD